MTEWFKKAFTENLPLKGLALVFSLGFFGYVHGQEDVRNKTLPVGVVSLPPEDGAKELMTKIPASIHVTLRGPARALNRVIQEGMAPVEVDLRETALDRVRFTREMFLLPDELEVVAVDPPELGLVWEDVVTRRIPLQASLTGQPSKGNVVQGEPQLEPREVTVKGPLSLVEVLQFARLAAFDVSGLSSGTYTRRIALDPAGPGVRFLGSQAATVTVRITEQRSERVFSSLPVEVIGPPQGTIVVPRFVDVTVVGPPDVLGGLREEQVVPQADLATSGKWNAAMAHGSVSAPVVVHLAEAEARVQPPFVTVKW